MGNSQSGEEANWDLDFSDKRNRLGQGSFAEVWKIKNKKDEKHYAGKFLSASTDTMSEKQKLSCERELEILKSMDHLFVVKYNTEFLYREKKVCIVTQYVSGGSFE